MLRIAIRLRHNNPTGEIIGSEIKTFEFEHQELEAKLRSWTCYTGWEAVGLEIVEREGGEREG